MTYEKAFSMLDDVKAFCMAEKRTLDKRTKTYDIAVEQLMEAYRVSCVVKNHLKTAQRQGKRKAKR